MTIVDAIKTILKNSIEPLKIEQIYTQIVEQALYDFRAADPKSVVRAQVRRHSVELDFPSASPVKYFRVVDGNRYTLESFEGIKSKITAPRIAKQDRLAEEVIVDAYKDHLAIVRQSLKQRILENHFAFFEQLVIDLLLRMGYGGSNPDMGIHTGGPGDEGIDGIIWEDKLGLGKIYIQAKRYRLDREVTPKEVREFAGAMVHVNKGVFITTSTFASTIPDWINKHEKMIKLVDGDELCNLMIAYGVGVSEVKIFKLLKVDTDYFSQE